MYTIDKGVPLPESDKHKYPFRHMEVGDSFLLPDSQHRASIMDKARRFGERNAGYYFVTRKTPQGTRLWRVSEDVHRAAKGLT